VPATPTTIIVPMMIPRRPASGMCPEQAADYRAACNGTITWAMYFRKWGSPSL
jgi:hypothetical protein